MTIDVSIIGKKDLHEMDNLDDYEFIDDKSNDEDDNDNIVSRICKGLLCAKLDNLAYICENCAPLHVVKK